MGKARFVPTIDDYYKWQEGKLAGTPEGPVQICHVYLTADCKNVNSASGFLECGTMMVYARGHGWEYQSAWIERCRREESQKSRNR
jgi:hypothetical protein